MSFPGMMGPGARGNGSGGTSAEEQQQQAMVKLMHNAMETCVVKSAMSGVMGFALGGAFGLFMSSMSYDTPLSPKGQQLSDLPFRQQVRQGFKDMGSKSFSSAKNFGLVGLVFAGSECCIEGFRAKNDPVNGIAGGCVTGAALAYKAGPQAAAIGCAGFAAFSAAIDYYLRMPGDS